MNNLQKNEIVYAANYGELALKDRLCGRGIYKILDFAINEHTKQPYVIYRGLFKPQIYVRLQEKFMKEMKKSEITNEIVQKERLTLSMLLVGFLLSKSLGALSTIITFPSQRKVRSIR